MASYQYVDATGALKTVDAADSNTALRLAANIAPHSGVELVPGAAAGSAIPGGGNPVPDPTISASPVRRYTGSGNGVTSQEDAYYASLNTAPVDEGKIRSQMRSDAQGQVDATNSAYDSIIANDTVTGVSNAGRVRATEARSGNIGSDFGNGAIGADAKNTQSTIEADYAAKASAIANILANVDTRADTAIQNANTLRQTNQEQYIQHLKDTADAARSDVIDLAKTGVTADSLTDDQYNKLLDQTGYTPEQLKAQFIINTPAATTLEKGVVGSKYYVISQDPITGKVSSNTFDLGFTPPQDYNSTTLDTGQIIFTPKNWDGDPSKIITYGAPSAKYNAEVRADNAAADKDEADTANAGDLSTADVKALGANGVPSDVAHGIFQDASNGYSDAQIQKNLTDTFGTELGGQYWTGFGDVMRKSATANSQLLTALGINTGTGG